MTDASLSMNRFAEGDFRVGKVLNRTFSVLSRNLLPFCVVTAIAYLPNILLFRPAASVTPSGRTIGLTFAGAIVAKDRATGDTG